jgi:hypothetical protein
MDDMSDHQIVTAGLILARRFYKSFGNDVPEGFKFYDSIHPLERGCWNLAVIAFEELRGTDLNESLANCEE